jgi:hypothetical protein
MTVSDVVITALGEAGSAFVGGTRFDLAAVGYEAAEYRVAGNAGAYDRRAGGVEVVERADFATRILVHRPREAGAFNGTVWVEWLNVSGGLDAAPDWIFAHTEWMRQGAAWVGVSAQKGGVDGEGGILGLPSMALVKVQPERYGSLHHPGDRFSYDIYSQVSAAMRRRSGTILDELTVERVMAIGESQSAFRLTTYANEIDPVTAVHDGFLVHARGRAAAPLDDVQEAIAALRGDPVGFRDDLRVPVLCVESETDLISLDYLAARQEDGDRLAVWEIAGSSHGDQYTFVVGPGDTGRLTIEELAKSWVPVSVVYGMAVDKLVNAGPQHYVMNAAVAQLERWVRDGSRPAVSARLEVRDGRFVTDEVGNVKGGIRTPPVEVPTAVLSGLGNSGHAIAYLCGSTVPFETELLAKLYRSRQDYVERYRAATDAAVTAGFVLAEDADEMVGIADLNAPL